MSNLLNRKCKYCGKEFQPKTHNQIFCSTDCSYTYRETINPYKGKTSVTTGAISELRVAIDLLVRGYDVFRSISPSCPCDLAVMTGNRLFRIEVRTASRGKHGQIFKHKGRTDNSGVIDIYAWVLPDEIKYDPQLPI